MPNAERVRKCREVQQRRWAAIYAKPLDRFWSKVQKSENGCWTWKAGRTYKLNGLSLNPARAMWILTKQPLPDPNIVVVPTCGNPDCIRPDHLTLLARGKHVSYPPVEEAFWSKVDVRGPDDCWNWKATLINTGYGHFQFQGRLQVAHRVAWILRNGDIPDGLFACHHCDNRKCVNPKHIFLGTHQDNMDDAKRKGRFKR